MAKPTGAAAKQLEKKALAEDTKSEGMRMLLTAGYEVTEVRDIFEAQYGFVYGVARRAGLVEATARAPRETKPAAKATAKTAATKAAASTTKTSKPARSTAKASTRRTATRRTKAKA